MFTADTVLQKDEQRNTYTKTLSKRSLLSMLDMLAATAGGQEAQNMFSHAHKRKLK